MNATCEQCERVGSMGNVIREYEVSSPIAVFTKLLCFRCYQRQASKRRKHVHIHDKVKL